MERRVRPGAFFLDDAMRNLCGAVPSYVLAAMLAWLLTNPCTVGTLCSGTDGAAFVASALTRALRDHSPSCKGINVLWGCELVPYKQRWMETVAWDQHRVLVQNLDRLTLRERCRL